MSEFSWWAVITRQLRQTDLSIREKRATEKQEGSAMEELVPLAVLALELRDGGSLGLGDVAVVEDDIGRRSVSRVDARRLSLIIGRLWRLRLSGRGCTGKRPSGKRWNATSNSGRSCILGFRTAPSAMVWTWFKRRLLLRLLLTRGAGRCRSCKMRGLVGRLVTSTRIRITRSTSRLVRTGERAS
jgi:hypothetical protein